MAGIIIWGLQRDTTELRTIRLPIFSQGPLPVGPQRLDPRHPAALATARRGPHEVSHDDFVQGDDDRVLFIPLARAQEIADTATTIRDTERTQPARMLTGTTFRNQARLTEYLSARNSDPDLTFRQHLRTFGGEIEE